MDTLYTFRISNNHKHLLDKTMLHKKITNYKFILSLAKIILGFLLINAVSNALYSQWGNQHTFKFSKKEQQQFYVPSGNPPTWMPSAYSRPNSYNPNYDYPIVSPVAEKGAQDIRIEQPKSKSSASLPRSKQNWLLIETIKMP